MSQPTPKANIALIVAMLRVSGAFFILMGLGLFLDVATLATQAGFTDEAQRHLVGGAIMAVGLIDFFVLPPVLSRQLAKKSGTNI